ncbi:MAG TPA: hypothetical protein VJZ00_11550 [Thermoanaerobaculia bacterium]|nr:hypothetical protein [Thermoanaerobaculia bacterium]
MLVRARIVAGPGGLFSVEIDDTPAALREEEVFRFALHYYARVLFDLVRTQRSVRELPQWIASIAQVALDADTDLFAVAAVEGALVRQISMPIADVSVTMRVTGVRNREVAGDLDALRGSVLARSVLAVCQSVLPRLSPPMRDAVPAALANMNASYELSHHYADPASQHEVPVLAYLAAAFV